MFTGAPAGVTLQDISGALYTEFAEFAIDTPPAVDPVMVDAAITLANARAFLVQDYLPARNAPVPPSEREQQRTYLYNKLTQVSGTAGIDKLTAQAATLQQWSPSDPRTVQAISLSLLTALYTCIFYNELAVVEPIETDAAADRASMRAAASAAGVFSQPLTDYVSGVTAGCSYHEWSDAGRLTDNRFEFWRVVLEGGVRDLGPLRAIWAVYRQILEGGGAALVAEMDAAVDQLSGFPGIQGGSAAEFRDKRRPKVVALGDWVASGRTALAALNNIATAQEGWSLCVDCSTLYLVAEGGICPANRRAHMQAGGPGYMLCTGTAPAGAQDHWFWCERCAALHYGAGPSVCPAPTGGAHSAAGSASYWLPSNAASVIDWRYCVKCGVMHDIGNRAGNVCAGGGAHETAGSGFYAPQQVPQWP
jgi:hypothetical protein